MKSRRKKNVQIFCRVIVIFLDRVGLLNHTHFFPFPTNQNSLLFLLHKNKYSYVVYEPLRHVWVYCGSCRDARCGTCARSSRCTPACAATGTGNLPAFCRISAWHCPPNRPAPYAGTPPTLVNKEASQEWGIMGL